MVLVLMVVDYRAALGHAWMGYVVQNIQHPGVLAKKPGYAGLFCHLSRAKSL